MKRFYILFLLLFSFHSNTFSQDTILMHVTDGRGFLIVDVLVNDSIEAKFILDTGGGLEIVSGDFFNRIKDSAVPEGIFTGFQSVGSRVDLELFRIPSIQIGNHKVEDIIIAPFPPLDQLTGISGLISMKMFEKMAFTIDIAGEKLILETDRSLKEIAKQAESITIYEHKQINITLDIFVPVRLNDKIDIMAEFDTGSGLDLIMLNPYYLKTLNIDTLSDDVTISIFKNIYGHDQSRYITSLPSVGITGSTLIHKENVEVTFMEELIYEGLIGSGLFRNNLLTIDYPNRRILIR